MPREKRASQFAPFDALKGLREALQLVEYEREKIEKGEVNEETAQKISNILNELDENTELDLIYFEDGYQKEYKGRIKLDVYEQKIKLLKINKTIMLDDLLDISINQRNL